MKSSNGLCTASYLDEIMRSKPVYSYYLKIVSRTSFKKMRMIDLYVYFLSIKAQIEKYVT